jgi:hypothetical protein
MSGVYLRAHPPKTPIMMFYGDDMPRFLAGFAPAGSLPYLPDIARLELAQRLSYHAADHPPIAPETLPAMAPDALMAARLTLAASVHLISSPYPIFDIWRSATDPNAPKPGKYAQDVLVTRPAFDPVLTPLPAHAADFITVLAKHNFGDALAAAGDDFDLTQTLGILISNNAIIALGDPT